LIPPSDVKDVWTIDILKSSIDYVNLKNECLSFFPENYRSSDKICAKVHRVLEPFKVRPITAGQAQVYHLGRLIQKPLHQQLRIRKEFQLGKELTPEVIYDNFKGASLLQRSRYQEIDVVFRRENVYNFLRDIPILTSTDWYLRTYYSDIYFTGIVAGDFKSATDAMHPRIPNTFCRVMYLEGHVLRPYYNLLMRLLGNHELCYGFKEVDGVEVDDVVLQTHGQLMGSPVSFPVLNIANAAVLWASVEEYLGRSVSWGFVLKHFRPLFNGDDVAFLSNQTHYRIWCRTAKSAGMTPSPGKNYFFEDIVQINSRNFRVEFKKEEDSDLGWGDPFSQGFREIVEVHEIFRFKCRTTTWTGKGSRRHQEGVEGQPGIRGGSI
jgi:hypothetical protein